MCSLALVLSGCKKKLKITKLCIKTHKHVVSLLQKEHDALPSGKKAKPEQAKQKAKLAKQIKRLKSKRGEERALVVCSKMSKKKVLVKRHECALQATSSTGVKHCYKPPRKKKGAVKAKQQPKKRPAARAKSKFIKVNQPAKPKKPAKPTAPRK